MKSRVTLSIIASATLVALTAVPAHALSGNKIAMDVPFEFTAGDALLPAGEYTARADGTILVLTDSTKAVRAIVSTTPLNTPSGSEIGEELLFHSYGDKHYLAGIRAERHGFDIEIRPSKEESELAQGYAVQSQYTVAKE